MLDLRRGPFAEAKAPMSANATPGPMGLLCLLLLLAAPASASPCDLLGRQQQLFHRQSLELLKGMKAQLPPECLRKMPAVSFPIPVLRIRQPRAATKALLEMLQGFLHLLKEDHRWVTWEAALRKRFLQKLHAQTQRVQRCLEGEKPTPGNRKEERMQKLQLKKYFRSIGDFLHGKGLDRCTQQFVRHEIQVALTYMDRLTERMKN